MTSAPADRRLVLLDRDHPDTHYMEGAGSTPTIISAGVDQPLEQIKYVWNKVSAREKALRKPLYDTVRHIY